MKKNKKNNISLYLKSLVIAICTGFSVNAQEHIINKPPQKWLRLAEEQFAQGHYRLALQSAQQVMVTNVNQTTQLAPTEKGQAKFIATTAQLKLDIAGAEDSALQFMAVTSNPVYQQRTAFYLAQYYFRHEQLTKAIPYYESANISNLTNQEIADLKFELAYAYFNNQNFEKAESLFSSIKEVQGKYYLAGNYYYGLLAYNDGNYEEALNSFKKVENDPQYKRIVPYYIAEIYYFKGEKSKALEEAVRLTRRPEKLFYDNELYLLAAQVLFEDQRYGEALPYFEHYYDNVDKIRKEELYEMAYSYYKVNEWKNAIEKFKPLSNQQDSLGQTAMYLLGDCYLKINDKKSARNAFGICSDMNFNPSQREASLLLYGKLSYEMGYNDVAMNSFTTLLNDYPNSVHKTEAKTLLGDLQVKTSNYAEAYETLRDAPNRNSAFWAVWQKVTYGYAMQQVKEGHVAYADSLLTLSLQQPADRTLEAAAYFWKGDFAYDAGRYAAALGNLREFTRIAPGNERSIQYLSSQATLPHAYLNMGYAAMELEQYKDAQTYFARSKQGGTSNPALALNATLREADAAFMQKDFKEAQKLYDNVIGANVPESDYAKIQKAIIAGIQGKPNEKVTLLQQVINKPSSRYQYEARYELAVTYIEDDKFQQAINLLEPITSSTDARKSASKALIKMGFAYQQLNNDTKAIETYRRIVTDFPASEERTAALDALRALYIENNQPDAYTKLLQEQNLPAIGAEGMDSTYYAAAEAQIAAGKWAAAKAALTQYIDKFPNGAFITKAQYYKAESHYQLKENEAALTAFDVVLSQPWNEFTEVSAKRAAEIAFNAGQFTRAMSYYQTLRSSAMSQEQLQYAYSGLMRSAFSANSFDLSSAYADTLLAMPDVPANAVNEVQFFKAKILQQQGRNGEALVIYEQLREFNDANVASEARYRIAEMYYKNDNLKKAEEEAAKATQLASGQWADKAWLLIVDILVKQKDYFNAKATLQSIIKNTKNTEFKKQAQQKLEEVKRLEKQQSKLRDE